MYLKRIAAVLGIFVWMCSVVRAVEIDETFSGTGPYFITPAGVTAPGDYNADRSTDASDYVVWRKNAGGPGPVGDGDDGSGTGTPDGVVDQNDYSFWKRHYGADSRILGFDEDNWQYAGLQGSPGEFDIANGRYDLAERPVEFVVTLPVQGDVWQSFSGVTRTEEPNGRMEMWAEFENFEPGTANTQIIIVQMNFGNTLGVLAPGAIEFIDLQMQFLPDTGETKLIVNPLADGGSAVGDIIRDLNTEGLLPTGEHITALDWHVVIDSDEDNGGSIIEVEFDINNSGTFTPFFSTPITGLDYTMDLTQAQTLQMSVFGFGGPILQSPGSPDPMKTGPMLSFDRFRFTTPDAPMSVVGVPEPTTITLLAFALGICCSCRARNRSL